MSPFRDTGDSVRAMSGRVDRTLKDAENKSLCSAMFFSEGQMEIMIVGCEIEVKEYMCNIVQPQSC